MPSSPANRSSSRWSSACRRRCWSIPGAASTRSDRRALLVSVRDALEHGVEQVNLCPPEGVTDELFSYVGSGTLFTEGDYTRVGPLALDEYEQAERLLERGAREGVLKLRSQEQVAQVLGAGFGVTVCGRHLAGVAGQVRLARRARQWRAARLASSIRVMLAAAAVAAVGSPAAA